MDIDPTPDELQWAPIYGIALRNPGYIYMIENQGSYKIGRTVSPKRRIREAKTWQPDGGVIGVKPFWDHATIEGFLHTGFADSWYAGEWFHPYDEDYSNVLRDGFQNFSDTDRFQNSIDFIYWFNSNGLSEFVSERYSRGMSIKKFQNETSFSKK